jgi:iron complex transport system ATP-binding protein
MEFETDESIGDLLEYVYRNGFHRSKDPGFLKTLTGEFELAPFLARKTQEVSKGELQRTILAFSLLYGSRIVMMDEPVFALEERQKTRCMSFIAEYVRTSGLSVYYSVHELEISAGYSDHILMISPDKTMRVGPTAEMFSRDRIEQCFGVPFDLLKKKEALYREGLNKIDFR